MIEIKSLRIYYTCETGEKRQLGIGEKERQRRDRGQRERERETETEDREGVKLSKPIGGERGEKQLHP